MSKGKKIVVICVSIIAVMLLAVGAAFGYCYVKASSDNIYPGIRVGELNLGNLSIDEAEKLIAEEYGTDHINVRADCEGNIIDISGDTYAMKADCRATAEKAAAFGRDGGILDRMLSVIRLYTTPRSIDLIVSCDYDTLQYAINEKLGGLLEDVQQYKVEIGEAELVITNGKSGRVVSAQKLLDLISKSIVSGTADKVLNISIETKTPDPIDTDKFVKEYNRAPKDATVTEDGETITITPEIIGVELDADTAAEIIEANRESAVSYTIPAIITHPEITAAQLEAEYMDTVIGTYSTNYSTSSANRKTNIHLASAKINGVTLNPGQVFSFNDTVGPRNAANGYKIAQVYVGGKSVDGIGGGICQVSSTLYNAVVLADLEITYRRNHTLPVSYVPLGRDATVSYGTIDFKVKNNKDTPIKLEVIHNGSTLTINVYGRKKYIKDISVETAITGSVAYTTTEVKDDTMFEGETKVEQAGKNGTKVEAYKLVKENGVVVSRTLLAKSSYVSTPKIVRVGTKKKEPEPVAAEPLPEPGAPDIPASGQVPEPPPAVPSDANPAPVIPPQSPSLSAESSGEIY